MSKRKYKSEESRRGEYQKLGSGGGLARSSNEGAVMALERRGKHVQASPSSTTLHSGKWVRKTDWYDARGMSLTLKHFLDAYLKVKRNKGSHGVDGQSLKDFEKKLVTNLYTLWNRVSSGSYFPPPVREKGIPKSNGDTRYLGVPTVGDRIVQQVIKTRIETKLEAVFSPNSWGYRPKRGMFGALKAVRHNVRHQGWVIDMDIAAFFDNVSHAKLNLALDRHVREPWIRTLINRWLSAGIQEEDGDLRYRQGRGTPQGGVISPLLANLYLHYALDRWLEEEHPTIKFVRYADDVIVHCNSYEQACHIRNEIRRRLESCELEMSEEKTQIVFCKRSNRRSAYKQISFDFLGYTFQPRKSVGLEGKIFTTFDCGVSIKSERKFCQRLKDLAFHRWTRRTIYELAKILNPIIAGWVNHFGKFNPRLLMRAMSSLNSRLAKWVCRRYKRFGKSMRKASRFLRNLAVEKPLLFYHWRKGYHTA